MRKITDISDTHEKCPNCHTPLFKRQDMAINADYDVQCPKCFTVWHVWSDGQ